MVKAMNIKSYLSSLEFKYQYLLPLLAKLPQVTAYRLVSFYGRFLASTHQAERGAIIHQMQQVLVDEKEEQLAQWADYFFLMNEREALDSFYFQTLKNSVQVNQFIELVDCQPLIDARKQGRRVMITSGHYGRFWMAGVGLKEQGLSVGTITRDGGDSNIHGLPEAEYQYRLFKLASLQQYFDAPFLVEEQSVRPIYKALDENIMAVFIDVPHASETMDCIELPFLGSRTDFPLGIARIAKKSKALIFPYYVNESRSGLQAKFHPALEAQALTDAEIMGHLVQLLETQILANPQQWWLWQALPMLWKN